MLSKKAKLILTFVIMTAVEFLSLGLGEIISVTVSLLFVITYIVIMINALKDDHKQEEETISPQLRLKTKAPF